MLICDDYELSEIFDHTTSAMEFLIIESSSNSLMSVF